MTAYTKKLNSYIGYSYSYKLPPKIGSKVYYSNGDTPETWMLEPARININITDNLNGRTRILTLNLANANNVKESIYTAYRRVKVVDNYTGLTIFLGRVDVTDPYWDNTYGQMLKVKCSDYSHELFVQKVNDSYYSDILMGATTTNNTLADSSAVIVLNQWVCAMDGTVTGISVYCLYSGNIKVSLYSDSSNTPNALLASSNGTACTANTWNYIALTSLQDVTKNTKYWIGTLSDTESLVAAYATTGTLRWYKASSYAGGFANPAGAGYTAQTTYLDCAAAVNGRFSALKRSELVKDLVDNYTSNVSPHAIDTSTYLESSGSFSTVSKNYTNSGRSPIDIIEELAKEDPWTNQTWAAVWRSTSGSGWIDNTTHANTGIIFSFFYTGGNHTYIGQNNPFLGATFTITTPASGAYTSQVWQYWNGSAWVSLTLSTTPDFTASSTSVEWLLPNDWAARAFSNGDPETGNPPNTSSQYWVRFSATLPATPAVNTYIYCMQGFGYDYYVDDSQYFHYARSGSVKSGLTVSLLGGETSATRNMMQDYSFCDQGREIITRATVKGTSSEGVDVIQTATNSTLESSLGITKEKIEYIWGKSMSSSVLTAYCLNRANALLTFQGGTINRGEFTISRYPYAAKTLTRVGSLVHIVIASKSIDGYYKILSVEYNEPDGLSKITCVSLDRGRSFSALDGISNLSTMKYGKDVVAESSRINDMNVPFHNITADGTITIGDHINGVIIDSEDGIIVMGSGTLLIFKNLYADTDYGFINEPGTGVMQIGSKQVQITDNGFTWATDTENSIRIGVNAAYYLYLNESYAGVKVVGNLGVSGVISTGDGITISKSSAPSTEEGKIYYSTTNHKLYVYKNDSTWHEILTG
jgi:hypothetical protein